jgi:hypothetical protein
MTSKNDDSERKSYSEFINQFLELENPIDPELPNQLYQIISQGIILCKLINKIAPGIINEKLIIYKSDPSLWEININHELAIKGAKDIGCTVVNIGPEDLSRGTPSLILGLLWQIIKKALMKNISSSTIQRLKDELENDGSLNYNEDLTPEKALIHWINYHLKKFNRPLLTNFSSDIMNSENYVLLMRKISPNIISQEDVDKIFQEKDLMQRAKENFKNG